MYNAFISYSHAADGKLAPALQTGLEKFAKPWYKIRNLNIFRDEGSLSPSPHLWSNIQRALDNSEYLIYMASPASAASYWVEKEIGYWITHKSIDKLLIVLTEGSIDWDNLNNSFSDVAGNSLPDILDKQFKDVPFYIDLRTTRSQKDLSLNNPIFKKEILKLAAQLHGKESRDLAGEEVLVHRKTIRTRNMAIGGLLLLFITALIAAFIANKNAKEASWQSKEAKRQAMIAKDSAAAAEFQRDKAFKARVIADSSANAAIVARQIADSAALAAKMQRDTAQIERDNAIRQKLIAIEQTKIARANYFASQAQVESVKDPTIGLRLAEVSMQLSDDRFIENLANTIYRENSFYRTIATLQAAGQIYNSITAIAVSPDGRLILTGSQDGVARLWRINGQLIRELKGLSSYIKSVGFSDDGKTILAQSDSIINLFDLDGNITQKIVDHSGLLVNAVRIPDPQSNVDKSISEFWANWGPFSKKFGNNIFSADKLAISPDRKLIAIATFIDNDIRIADPDGKIIRKFRAHSNFLTSVAFSPDGKSILTCSYDSIARLWDLSGKLLSEMRGHSGKIISGIFLRDGNSILTGAQDGSCRLWDLHGILIQQFKGDYYGANCMDFFPDGKTIVSGCDRMLRMWTISNKPVIEFALSEEVSSASFSPDGKYILTCSHDYTARLWDIKGNLIREFKGENYSLVISASFSPDGKYILIYFGDIMRLYTPDGKFIREFNSQRGRISTIAFSPKENLILCCYRNGSAALWNMNAKVIKEIKSIGSSISSVVFLPDEKRFLVGSWDNPTKLFDIEGNLLHNFKGDKEFSSSLAVSPNGKYYISGGSDIFSAKLWDIKGNLIHEFVGHTFQVISVAFSPDGNYVITGARDNTIKLWKLSGELIKEFKGFMGSVNSVAFSPDGKFILAGISDNTARLWKFSEPLKEFLRSNQIDQLTPEQKKRFNIK